LTFMNVLTLWCSANYRHEISNTRLVVLCDLRKWKFITMLDFIAFIM
jgi:hypothetical protein